MERSDDLNILDKQSTPEVKGLWTIKLFLTGGAIILLVFIMALLWGPFGLNPNNMIFLALALMIAFGINIAGTIFGFAELKKNKNRSLIGIMGNIILMIFFLMIVLLAYTTVTTTT